MVKNPNQTSGDSLKIEGVRKTETTTTTSTVPHRAAYSPSEFASLFGRHASWAYRRIYEGRVKVIKPSGSMLIPACEVNRLVGEAHVHVGGGQ